MGPVVLARRSFLVSLGLAAGSLALGVARPARAKEPDEAPGAPTFPQLPSEEGGFTANAFVHVAPDGKVSIVCSRSEMGQGIRSSLPALIADEMGADLARVVVVQADGDKAYGDQDTDGSSSIRGHMFEDMRRVGATARVMLVAAAAKTWRVPPAQCEAHDHAVVHAPTKRSLGFGELAKEAAKLPVPAEKDVALRPRAELKRIGGPLPNVDAKDIVTGRAVYGADVRLPGMLVAVVARSPAPGGSVKALDASRALAVPGVKKVVQIPGTDAPFAFKTLAGVAVVADTTWAAMRGRAALDVTWDLGPNGSYDSAAYRERLLEAVRKPGKEVRNVGDVDAALAKAKTHLVAEYVAPHLAHAPMEPPCSLAKVDASGCETWSPSQEPQVARHEVAEELGLDEAKVRIHTTLLGGAFGRKAKPDYDREAAFLAREMKAPVRAQWTREDDLAHDYFHTTSAQRLEAALDDGGKVTAWLHRTAFPSISATFDKSVDHGSNGELSQGVLDTTLAVPNVRAECGEAKSYTRVGWLRSVCNIHHAFAIGSFIDEIAHARGVDPRGCWLDLLGPPRSATLAELGVAKLSNYGASLGDYPLDVGRLRHTIERVTDNARWGDRKKDGRALGLAAHRSFLACVAVVASAARDARGKVRIDEAWIVADCGLVVNPDRVRAQMEGAFVFAMSHALHGAITMKAGAVEQRGLRDYRLTRIHEAPRAIHVELVPSEARPTGAGEPGVPPVAPAIANAVFALTGTRVRELPLQKAGVV